MKKLLWPIIGTIVMSIFTTFQDAMTDNHIDSQEWVLVGLGALMAFNVWATANLPQYGNMKTYVAAAIVVVGALHTFIVGGISTQEMVNMVVLAMSALGVAFTPQPLTTVVAGKTVVPTDPIAE